MSAGFRVGKQFLGGWHDWPNQACVWVNTNPVLKNTYAATLLYFTTPWFAGLTRHRRALSLSKLIRAYSVKDWRIVIVAHSEGTATALLALRLAGWPKVHALHLLSGACDANFERNGLNFAMHCEKVEKVFCYGEEKDSAMKLENSWIGKLCFLINLKDASLGLVKEDVDGFRLARNVSASQRGKVTERFAPDGHSDWFLPSNFDNTMQHCVLS